MYIEPAKTNGIVFFFFSFLDGGDKEKGETKSHSDMPSWQLMGNHIQLKLPGPAFEAIPQTQT